MNVGIAGTGRMGAAIATRLLGQGHAVTVWNRTPAKTAPLVAAGAKAADSPAALASASEAIITILTDAAAIDATYTGADGAPRRRREGQALHRDEHGAARDRAGAGGEGAREGRGDRRVPGRRHDRPGARRQALRLRRRHRRRFRAREAAARRDVPADRARRPGRGRREHEARDQPAAPRLLAGPRRGALARAAARPRAGAPHGHLHRHFGRAEHAQEPGRVDGDPARRRRRPAVRSRSTTCARTCAR